MKLDLHRNMLLVCVLVLVVGCLAHIAMGYSDIRFINRSQHAWGSDDAYISYRYAKNFVEGQGLVFNAGERVEGYSNFLYVLIITIGLRFLDGRFIYLFSAFINIIFIVIALFTFRFLVKRRLGYVYATLATVLMSICLPLWAWVASGLETPLVLLIQVVCWLTLELTLDDTRFLPWLCLALIASLLVRADGFILPMLVIAYCVIQRRWRIAAYITAAAVFAMSIYVGWRFSYYGDFLPNTFYVKVSGSLLNRIAYALIQLSDILVNDGTFIYAACFLIVFVMLAAILISPRRHMWMKRLSFSMFFAFGWLAYWIFIGGDVYYDRFLIILFPLGIFTFLSLLKNADTGWQKWRSRLIVVIAVIVQLTLVVTDARFKYSTTKYDSWLTLGDFLGQVYPDKLLAVDAAGKVPYLSNQTTIDILGLNDYYIAHQPAHDDTVVGHMKYDVDYVLSRSPDLIATWINSQLNMNYGFDRKTYLAAGYQLKYLLYAADALETAEAGAIIDISGADDSQIRHFIEAGYYYAVLLKQ